MPNICPVGWKTGGIVIGVLSLIGSFPISASGDLSVSCTFSIKTIIASVFICAEIQHQTNLFIFFFLVFFSVHFLLVSGCLLYGIYKVIFRKLANNLLFQYFNRIHQNLFFDVFFFDYRKSQNFYYPI